MQLFALGVGTGTRHRQSNLKAVKKHSGKKLLGGFESTAKILPGVLEIADQRMTD